jgi:membrane fusion protein (multidrug efflux system)
MNAEAPISTRSRPAELLRRWRRPLMVSLPLLLLLVGAALWLMGGRYVSTDNAYVRQDRVTIAPEVAGRIAKVQVSDNQPVSAGQILFEIDAASYRIALADADATVARRRLEVDQLRAAYHDSQARLKAAEQELGFRQREFERQSRLAQSGYAAKAHIDEVRHAMESAQQQLQMARQGVESARAALGGDAEIATEQHPLVREAIAARDKAALDLERTTVRAPADGIVSQTERLQVGQFVTTGMPVASLVETGSVWVEANLKETDLAGIRPGQHAEIEVDAYPGSMLRAEVESIGAGTGSEFSLLPSENATGNWVKVVQRVPVRLRLLQGSKLPLRAGLSTTVTVDTGQRRGLFGTALAGSEAASEQADPAPR